MRLEKVSLAIVAVVVLVILAVPFWRGLALSQLRQTMPGRAETVWTGNINASTPSLHPKTDAQLLKEHPNDFLLRLTLVARKIVDLHGASDKPETKHAAQAARKLVQDYPGQGAAYMCVLGLPEYDGVDVPSRMECAGILPEEAAKYWHDPGPPTEKQLEGCRHFIEMVDKAIAADPGNGWLRVRKAWYLYGLRRDAEALAEMHRAAGAPRFTDYSSQFYKAADHLLDLRGGFVPEQRAHKAAVTPYSGLALIRATARITAHLAYAQIRQGNTDRGVRTALNVTAIGTSMCKQAPTYIHGLVGRSMLAIGASVFDPSFAPTTDDPEAREAARIGRYTKFLVAHGYVSQARVLDTQWRQMTHMVADVRRTLRDRGDHSADTVLRFPIAFADSTALLAALMLVGMLWMSAWLLKARNAGRTLWDRRAGMTAALLCTLFLAPMVSDPVRPAMPEILMGLGWGPQQDWLTVHNELLLVPCAVIVLALVIGFAVMLKRTPAQDENRKMSRVALLVAYLAAFAGLAYLHCELGLQNLPPDLGIRDIPIRMTYAQVILGPALLLILYALLRAVQSQFGRVRQSAPLTFVATIRYGSAVAVALLAAVYLCTLVWTAHLGVRADNYARHSMDREAAVVQSAFR